MPEMDGYEVCGHLKADEKTRGVPVIFISALDETVDKVKAFDAGGVDYITKPFQRQEPARVETHLSLRKAQERLKEQNARLEREIMERKRAQEALQRAHDELEQRVEDRTSLLAAANDRLKQEIRERKRAEERVRHLNSVLTAIRNINQLIIQEKDPQRLMNGVCARLLETRPYYNAWIAIMDNSGKPVSSAEAGLGRDFQPMRAELARRKLPWCVRSTMVRSDVLIIEDPFSKCTDCSLAKNYSGRGGMAVRLEHGGDIFGLLSLSVSQDHIIDEEEKMLIKGLAGDIAFALHTMKAERSGEAAERALGKSEEKYRTLYDESKRAAELYRSLLHTSADAIVLYDLESNTRYMNPAFTDIFGWTMAEMKGKPMPFLPESEKEATTAHIREIVEKGKPVKGFETKRQAKDGGVRDVCLSGSRYNDNEGNPAGMLVILRDISQRKRLEALLQQAQKMEAIGTLAGGIAHDFNNILGVIIGSTELALSEAPEDAAAHRYLMRVLKAGNRAAGLVQQILAFSRQTEQERKPIQPGIIIKEALKMLSSTLPSTIQIEQYIRKDSGIILSDPTRVHQIVMNLCTNAAHAMREKGGTLRVALSSEDIGAEDAAPYPNPRPGPYVKLTVSDTGHGMDPKVMERIFDPYFTTKGLGEGTGLGLAVVYGIVTGYGGTVKVHSVPGEGSTFQVLLPRIEETEKAAEIEELDTVPAGNERVLLVDDEEDLVDTVREILKRLGYQVTAETSSIEALKRFRNQPDEFDLVITDQTMPKMTGADLAEKLIRIRPDIPIILCTGFSELISKEKAERMGVRGFVMKPVVTKEMAGTVRKVLDRGIDDWGLGIE